MPPILSAHEPVLVNVIGHSVGALVFGLFLLLVRRGSRQTTAAAGLAFFWNFASLAVLAARDFSMAGGELWVTASTSALSLLPAVLLHVWIGSTSWLVFSGYAVSATAVGLHVSEHFSTAQDWHKIALVFTTLGFGILTAIALGRTWRLRRGAASRLVGAMALFLFSVTFVHFDAGIAHGQWSAELLIHHAGVPLALLVLMQDYRFTLLDVFVRVLASFALAACVLYAGIQLSTLGGVAWQLPETAFRQGVLLTGACLLLVLSASLHAPLQSLLMRIAFGRRSIDELLDELRRLCSECESEQAYIDLAASATGRFFGADVVEAGDDLEARLKAKDLLYPATAGELNLTVPGVDLVVPLRITPDEVRHILLGPRRGGRRYLSEDLATLARLGSQMLEHLEHFRTAEMRRLVAQAELRALESQIQPHFLFNALNTLYGTIPREAAAARRVVLSLSDILRYCLQPDRTFIRLGEELAIIRSYLEIEKLRLGERLRIEMEIAAGAEDVLIPLLTVEPLVENAIKHGVSKLPSGGLVRIEARHVGADLQIRVTDTGGGFGADNGTPGAGVGMSNVEKRLKLCYGPAAGLAIVSSDEGTSVEFKVPSHRHAGVPS